MSLLMPPVWITPRGTPFIDTYEASNYLCEDKEAGSTDESRKGIFIHQKCG